MKRLFLSIVLIAGVMFTAEAQNRSIGFEQVQEWKKVVKKAKKEKKLIFVDCYTSWCGPCKMLAKNVFTVDSVADFFNATFVNAKYDMEKDADGPILRKKFDIKAFPTLVFVDPATEQVVHRMVGAGTAGWLMAGAKAANDPQNNLSGLTKRYENGERGVDFLNKYLVVLSSSYMQEERNRVAVEFLNALSDDELVKKENWDLINNYINDPLSKQLRYVMANREKFAKVAGIEVVEHKLDKSIRSQVMALATSREDWNEELEKTNAEMVKYLLSADYLFAPSSLASLYTAEYARKGDFRGMLDNMREAFKYNMFRNGSDRTYFQQNIESLQKCTDKALVEEGIRWIDERCVDSDDYFNKANLMNSKARLQKAIGDTLGADKSKVDEEKYNAEGEKRNGGRAVRAMRMN